MIVPALLCAVGLPAGFLLIRRVPVCSPGQPHAVISLSIVIPARNEEENLPRLLRSIAASTAHPAEVLVVDDASTDNTAGIAQSLGATVITSVPLPAGWTGKSWACYQGAQLAIGEYLLFLDADTFFIGKGLDGLMARYLAECDPGLVLSVLPYHSLRDAYEQFSLFFNILMAAGAGGFGALSEPRLFGQSLLIAKETYFAVGGHSAVRGFVLENVTLSHVIRGSGARILCLGGHGTLHMRMFPEGPGQMSDSWTKAFLQGAAASGGLVLTSAVVWISALWSALMLLIAPPDYGRLWAAGVYLIFSLQLVWLARRLGSYRFFTCLLYPLPLAYYCAVFGRSAAHRALRRKTVWRGREV
jgi:4,4'-diaponeurosporenoate glycosyltransferase